MALKGGYKAVLLEGSPGTMKTGAAFALAYHLNGLIFKMDCTPDMDEVNLDQDIIDDLMLIYEMM